MKTNLGAQTLLFPMPVLMVGTYDRDEKPNLMVVAWGGICCGQPPCIAVSLRKATYSYACIVERKAFTVGVACEERMAEADYCGMHSGRDGDKFEAAGLTYTRSEVVDAPYAEEFPVVLECRLTNTTDLGLHTQFVGEIMNVRAEESVLDDRGNPDIMKIRPLIFDFVHSTYHGVGSPVGKAFSVGGQIQSERLI